MRTSLATAALAVSFLLTGCSVGQSASALAAGPYPEPLFRDAGAQPTLFVADAGSSVLLYTANIHQRNPPLLGEITNGVSRSADLWVDRGGTLYVVNGGGGTPSIAEYKRGSSSPFKTITNGLRSPGCIAVDAAENLYVSDSQGSKFVILVYGPGATSPTRTIPMPGNGAGGLALGRNGSLLAANFAPERSIATVFVIPRGTSKVRNLHLQGLPNGASLGTDKAGYIYVGGFTGDISIYAPGSKTPARTINLSIDGFYTGLTVTADGAIYWPNVDHQKMYEFAPGASQPTNVFTTLGDAWDVAVGAW